MLHPAYVAGIIDGEGSIGVHLNSRGNFNCYVQVCNTDVRLLDAFRADFGGVNITKYGQPSGNAKSMFQWQINGRKALPMLKYCQPFLLLKGAQATLFIEMVESCFVGKGNHRSSAQETRANEITAELSVRNHRGIPEEERQDAARII